MTVDRIQALKSKIEVAVGTCDEPTSRLLKELMQEAELLLEENKRLRQALVKSAAQKTSGMSSKLKDALYE